VHKLAQSVLAYIRRNDLLRPGDRVGIAVSAGADSVALLRLMLDVSGELGVVPSVVHLNHQLRGAESDADERFARDLAEAHKLDFLTESLDVKAHAAEKKLGLEAAAREVRYELFGRALHSGVDRIATGHTLDDQAETVLLKMARGAGTRGLAGIYPKLAIDTPGSTGLAIVRPLLGTRRAVLRSYLAEIGQSWREDASNQDLRHTRNRVRHEILPRLEQDVNPGVCETLAETAEIARAEEAYWGAETSRLLPQLWRLDEHGGILQLKHFASLPLAIRRRLIRAAAEAVGLALEFRHVEEILNQACEGSASMLPGDWTVARHGDELRFQKASEEVTDYQYELSVPGRIAIVEAGIVVEAIVINGRGSPDRYTPQHLVDSSCAQKQWLVRNWRAGERFWPAHTKEPKKIKELLQDRHIIGKKKQRWPVIACGGEIIWLSGFGVRRDFQAQGNHGILLRELEGK